MRYIIVLIVLLAGCAAEEATCEDVADEQRDVLRAVCDAEPDARACICWDSGLTVDWEACGCGSQWIQEQLIENCNPVPYEHFLDRVRSHEEACR